eukprot:snap_masked-scaffold_34-processed-gene-2.1-mRNA-1 protein AED:1.00 eAED:1.00 QI:0/0/0/0/1/1/2/0/142
MAWMPSSLYYISSKYENPVSEISVGSINKIGMMGSLIVNCCCEKERNKLRDRIFELNTDCCYLQTYFYDVKYIYRIYLLTVYKCARPYFGKSEGRKNSICEKNRIILRLVMNAKHVSVKTRVNLKNFVLRFLLKVKSLIFYD